jgi:uncharacterized caspase-like protein
MLPQPEVHRRALIIGNASYPGAPLRNPTNDATAMGQKLVELGFDVRTELNLTGEQFRRVVGEFCNGLAKDTQGGVLTEGVFFYAGHGLQVDGENYLLPIDGQIFSKLDLKQQTVDLAAVLEALGAAARTSIVILDCCRDNPLPRTLAPGGLSRSLSMGQGLANVRAPKGVYVAFATQPHFVALDGPGMHSPFTEALLEYVDDSGKHVTEVLMDVRKAVYDKTNGQQIPWDHSALFEPFKFAPGEPATLKGLAEPERERLRQEQDLAREESYWKVLQSSKSAEFIQSFLVQYPNSRYRSAALDRIDQLKARAQLRRWAPIIIAAIVLIFVAQLYARFTILRNTDIASGDILTSVIGPDVNEPEVLQLGYRTSLFMCRANCFIDSLFGDPPCAAFSYDNGICYPKFAAEFSNSAPAHSEVMPGFGLPVESKFELLWDRALRGDPVQHADVEKAAGRKLRKGYNDPTNRTYVRTERASECQTICANLPGICKGFTHTRQLQQCELFSTVRGIVKDADSGLEVHIPATFSGCIPNDPACR